jgi:hypothetical protein
LPKFAKLPLYPSNAAAEGFYLTRLPHLPANTLHGAYKMRLIGLLFAKLPFFSGFKPNLHNYYTFDLISLQYQNFKKIRINSLFITFIGGLCSPILFFGLQSPFSML